MLPLRGIRPKNACSRLEKDGDDEEDGGGVERGEAEAEEGVAVVVVAPLTIRECMEDDVMEDDVMESDRSAPVGSRGLGPPLCRRGRLEGLGRLGRPAE